MEALLNLSIRLDRRAQFASNCCKAKNEISSSLLLWNPQPGYRHQEREPRYSNDGPGSLAQSCLLHCLSSSQTIKIFSLYLPPNLAPPSLWTRVCHVIVPILDSFVSITTGTSLIHPCQQLN